MLAGLAFVSAAEVEEARVGAVKAEVSTTMVGLTEDVGPTVVGDRTETDTETETLMPFAS